MICLTCNFYFEETGCLAQIEPKNGKRDRYEEYQEQLEFMFPECSADGEGK